MGSKVIDGLQLRVVRLSENGTRRLLQPLRVRVGTALNGAISASGLGVLDTSSGIIEVFAWFITDYSSIPTPLQWFVRWSRVDIAGVAHDFLYRHTTCTRRVADDVWWELALSGRWSANRFQAWVCWVMLRGFGGWCREKDRQHSPLALTGAAVLLAAFLLVALALAWCVVLVAAPLFCWVVDLVL